MTRRAIFLGFLLAVGLCTVSYFNDEVIDGTFLVDNHFPISVFGGLMLVLLVVNPLLGKFGKIRPFSGREMAVMLCLVLAVCFVPGRGLGKNFSTVVALPWQHEKVRTWWQGDVPTIAPAAVLNWAALHDVLQAASRNPEPGPLRRVWALLSTETQQAVSASSAAELDVDARNRLLDGLNAVLARRDFYQPAEFATTRLPPHLGRLVDKGLDGLDDATVRRLNRDLLDVVLGRIIASRRVSPLEAAPPRSIIDVSRDSSRVLDGYVTGLATGDQWLPPSAVPWSAWKGPLLAWLPLVFTLAVGLIGMALVLHYQWAHHELLAYPIVAFTRALFPQHDAAEAAPDAEASVFRTRGFWITGGIVFAIIFNNYLFQWWPQYLIPITTTLDLSGLAPLAPNIVRGGGGWLLSYLHIYFSAVGLAYFLATDVAFSMGIAPFVYLWFAGILAGYGVSLSLGSGGGGGVFVPGVSGGMSAGGYCGLLLVLLWTGRHYYGSVVRRGLRLPCRDAVPRDAVWGFRVMTLAGVLGVVQLALLGLAWPLALAYIALFFAIQLVMGRLIAEAGIFYMHSLFSACGALWMFLGARAVGPDMLLVMQLASAVLLVDPSGSAMPFLVNGVKLVDSVGENLGRAARLSVVAVALGIMVAIPSTIYLQYQTGASQVNGWVYNVGSAMAWEANLAARTRLDAEGVPRSAEALPFLARMRASSPSTPCLIGFAIVCSLVFVFAALRLRFTWWPFHPLMLVVMGSWHAQPFAFSLLLGCGIKWAVTKYGGIRAYQAIKPCMVGAIAGELLGGILPMLIGAIYYFLTGESPVVFRIRP
ncbi:MAG: hypothetical protein A3K19_23035 [Lentisphaerae bacterium RIFOXYB12_FULL_65_16]|nr:MAG: hypothetical protein A3K18_16720 [Lentisphaerae bacterium RIFOXYA12_64_32]OGV90085.1 MAG: hypothetical protein A3K19_23035 [Lentisphaerae bacterium RIFOXYB12_FULL_65_16]